MDSLVLKFLRNRVISASPKNFLFFSAVPPTGRKKKKVDKKTGKEIKGEEVEDIMQYGIGENERWNMDFKNLGLVMAAGLAGVAELWEGE